MRFSPFIFAGLVFCSAALAAEPLPQVELKTNVGTIVLELYPEAAPKTVKNFLQYVKSGFYSGTIFHRVIDNFMIQGGGMDKNINGKRGNPPIPLEAQYALDHGVKNQLGTIAMAREYQPNTATSEFFINVADNDFLDAQAIPDGDPVQVTRRGVTRTLPRAEALLMMAGYAPFGRVIDGMDVVYHIKAAPTDAIRENLNVPRKPIIIISARLLKKPIKAKTIEEQLEPAASPELTPAQFDEVMPQTPAPVN